MEDRIQLEAQFWWAFACLALAGRRQPEDFHAELLRRCADSSPTDEDVRRIVDEACCHLAVVLNATVNDAHRSQPRLSGWERHLLALSTRPD